jgi:hypothetical protein
MNTYTYVDLLLEVAPRRVRVSSTPPQGPRSPAAEDTAEQSG